MFDPPIAVRQFPKLFCKQLVDELDKTITNISSSVFNADGTSKVDNYHRSSSAMLVDTAFRRDTALIMLNAVDLFASTMLAKRASLSEPLQFLKYDKENSGHFLAHTDNAYYDSQGIFRYTSPKRVLTCVAYINDDYEGGELVFNTVRDDQGQPIKLKPAIGEMVIFPSDIRFMHEVLTVTKGRRYSIVGWYDLK